VAVAIVGELTADRSRIVLVAAGSDPEVADAARTLHVLTPLCERTTPPGALQLPATWPAVVQLAEAFGAAWRPGPALTAWIAEQVHTRMSTGTALTVAPPAGCVPRSYQVAGACLIAATGRMLLFDDPGVGKSVTTILGLLERAQVQQVTPILVVAPTSVVDPWLDEFRKWAPRWVVRAWRGTPAQRRAMAGTADVYVTSYGTVRRDAADTNPKSSPLISLGARSVVADECLPTGTPILTPAGVQAIELLNPGDYVMGIDHETGTLTPTPVRHTFTRATSEPLTYVHGVLMTPNHPVWTSRGYVSAADVTPDDLICEVRTDAFNFNNVRVVRNCSRETSSADEPDSILQQKLFSAVADVSPGIRRYLRHPTSQSGYPTEMGDDTHEAGRSGEIGRTLARSDEPVSQSGGATESARGSEGPGIPRTDRRQRSRTYRTTSATRQASWLADGSRGAYGPDIAIPISIQSGCGISYVEGCDRGGRRESQRTTSASTRREERRAIDGAWLDGTTLHQRTSSAEHGPGAGGDFNGRVVHNIETGTGNYVAAGLLVHNCHLIKNSHAAQSKAVRRLAERARVFVGLSGTPITHSPADLWPALVCVEPGAWPSRERYLNRYIVTLPGDYAVTPLGFHPHAEAEFRTTILGRHRRVAKADVLAELPDKVHSVRVVDIPPAYRKAYDQMESQMLAELPDGMQLIGCPPFPNRDGLIALPSGEEAQVMPVSATLPGGKEISVMHVLAQLTRLLQLSCAAADVEVTTKLVEDPETGLQMEEKRQHVTLKAPSWKVDALLEVLAERPGEPVVVFAPSRQLIMLAAEAATRAGYRVGLIVGGQTAKERTRNREAFQAGELDVICVTTGSGGVGLTLTASRTAVFLQRPWSLVEAMQAEDRLHRYGAERHDSIDIIDIVARNTIDTRVRAVLRERAGQLADLVQDPRIVAELLGGAEVRDLRRKKAAA
jgi:hypothetical protein